MARRKLQEAILASQELSLSDWSPYSSNNDELIETKTYKTANVKKEIETALDQWGIYSMQYSHNGRCLALGFGNGGILSVDIDSGEIREITSGNRRIGLAVMALYHHPRREEMLISAGAAGKIHLWDLAGNHDSEPVETLVEEENEINSLDFCLDGLNFGTVGKDRKIRLYDGKSMQLLKELEGPDYTTMDEATVFSGHTKRVFALKFHPNDNNIFITAGWDDCMKVWDKRMAKNCKKFIPGPHICGPSLDIWDNEVISGSWRAKDTLQLWDLRKSSLIKNIAFPHDASSEGEFLYCTQFASSDVVIAGGSGTNNACAVSTRTEEVLGVVQSSKPVMALDIFHTGNKFCVGGIGGHLMVATLEC